MTCLLDTHFLVWIAKDAKQLRRFKWLSHYEPWGVSAISLLEIQILMECGRIHIRNPHFTDAVMTDPRFVVDDVSLVALTHKALALSWTRDPFDRLVCAHSLVRRLALCSVDTNIQENHKLLVPELR